MIWNVKSGRQSGTGVARLAPLPDDQAGAGLTGPELQEAEEEGGRLTFNHLGTPVDVHTYFGATLRRRRKAIRLF
jgi:hypothetical protein